LVHRDARRRTETIDLTVRTPRPPGSAQHDGLAVETLLSTLASYSGHLRWGGSWRAWCGIWQPHPWLASLYDREGEWRGRRACRPRQVVRIVRPMPVTYPLPTGERPRAG